MMNVIMDRVYRVQVSKADQTCRTAVEMVALGE
jgi:hypothetical protein